MMNDFGDFAVVAAAAAPASRAFLCVLFFFRFAMIQTLESLDLFPGVAVVGSA
jgi:hypothetical protein